MAQKLFGIGCDIVSLERIKRAFSQPGSLNKVFTDHECAYFSKFQEPWGVIAGHFAAKEATVKALGTGFREGIGFLNLEVRHDALGKPSIELSSELAGRFGSLALFISISHEKEFAIGYATAVKND